MAPDAAWPNLPSYREFSPADHAAHTSPRGVPYPETLMGTESVKATKSLFKAASKPHMKFGKNRRTATRKHKKKVKA